MARSSVALSMITLKKLAFLRIKFEHSLKYKHASLSMERERRLRVREYPGAGL